MFYEFLNVDGKVSTGLKYAIAGASASSALQNCPHQVEKMGISAGINGFQDYDATIERASMERHLLFTEHHRKCVHRCYWWWPSLEMGLSARLW